MKRLLILRHAQALGNEPGGTDKTRKLSPQGMKDARALGKLMAREKLKPDLVLCSNATRTRQTLDGVLENIDAENIDYSDNLYNADFTILLRSLQAIDDSVDCALIVAHNPGIHTLAARLADDDAATQTERLMMGYAPATLTVMDCGVESWTDLEVYSNSVRAVHETTEYNSSDRPTRWM